MRDPKDLQREHFDELRELYTNGAPEWLLLFLTTRSGTVGNTDIMRLTQHDAANWKLSPQWISRARKHLVNKGLLKATTSTRTFYRVAPGLDEHLQRLFDELFIIGEIIRENRDYSDINRLKKNGKIKRKEGSE